MITDRDKRFLRRAMRLAMNGRGHVEPNPMVGCVLVKNDQVIGEGWHVGFGKDHAEPTALNDCKSRGNDPAGATAYVTLEPCCHTNKKTPPCAPRLINAKITRVVIGCLDPNPDVNGKGVAMLRNAGIEVDCLPGSRNPSPLPLGEGKGEGLPIGNRLSNAQALTPTLSHEERELDASHFKQLIAPFILRVAHHRPFVTMKWAESVDGFVAGANGRRVSISNTVSNHFVHQLRSRSGGIVVGVNTILNDDPSLTVRGVDNLQLQDIYILDSAARTPLSAKVLASGWVTIVSGFAAIAPPACDRLLALVKARTQTTALSLAYPSMSERIRLQDFFEPDLIRHAHLLVEAGPTVAKSFFNDGFCDRLIVIRSSKSIREIADDNPNSSPKRAAIPPHFLPVATLNLAGDVLTEYLNIQSPAYFAPVPSADFVLAREELLNAPDHQG